MKMTKLAMALAAVCGFTSAGNGAVVTNRYTTVASFNGPMMKVTTSFDLTFDPTIVGWQTPILTNYRTDGGGSFADPVVSYFFSKAGGDSSSDTSYLNFDGKLNGGIMATGSDDFSMFIETDNAGNAVTGFSSYTTTGTNNFSRSTAFTVSSATLPGNSTSSGSAGGASVAAVPEPATWAMMMLGFGMIGGAVRYRRRSVAAALA